MVYPERIYEMRLKRGGWACQENGAEKSRLRFADGVHLRAHSKIGSTHLARLAVNLFIELIPLYEINHSFHQPTITRTRYVCSVQRLHRTAPDCPLWLTTDRMTMTSVRTRRIRVPAWITRTRFFGTGQSRTSQSIPTFARAIFISESKGKKTTLKKLKFPGVSK